MATLCRPAVSVPDHVITMEQTLGWRGPFIPITHNSRWRCA